MRTAAQLQHEAWQALVERLGLADALRYRILFQPGTGDYVKEREQLFRDMSMDDWLRELAEWEKEHPRT